MHKIKIGSIAIILTSLLVITITIAYTILNNSPDKDPEVNIIPGNIEVCNKNLIKNQGIAVF